MHDLLRDLAITKAEEKNFLTVFSKQDGDVNQLAEKNPFRAALQFCTPTQDGVYSKNTLSLICFGFGKFGQFISYKFDYRKLNYSGFRLLRVLTLERVDMVKYTQPQWLQGLADLRYLGLRGCRYLPDIFEKFSNNLETIDLKGSIIAYGGKGTRDLCDVVIPTLRHVYGVSIHQNLPFKWDQHTNLQTIKNVPIKIAELECCFNLRTLGISIEMGPIYNEIALEEWQNLKCVLRRNEQLVYLRISNDGRYLPFGGTTGLPCHRKIQRLYLAGEWVRDICVPSVEMFPTNLTKLTLIYSGLEEDPMPILERLWSLRILYLGPYSYVGTKLICLTGGFLNLKTLKLRYLENLCHWDIKEGAMPTLTHLQIEDCKKLHTLPELQKVPTLQELIVIPSRKLCESMQGDEDVYKIEHIPYTKLSISHL
jgi:hypothetical protein